MMGGRLGPLLTADGFPVSSLTGLCDHHAEVFAALAAQVIDAPNDDYPGGASDRVDEMREYLTDEREACITNCGREGER
jgi:hypothetical protein